MKASSIIEINNADNYKEINNKVYQHIIEKLIYLLYSTKLDIAFVVGQLNKQNADLRVGHLKTAKQVIWYFNGIMYLRIVYGAITNIKSHSFYDLVGYADNKHIGNLEEHKSVKDYFFFTNYGVVSWYGKK